MFNEFSLADVDAVDGEAVDGECVNAVFAAEAFAAKALTAKAFAAEVFTSEALTVEAFTSARITTGSSGGGIDADDTFTDAVEATPAFMDGGIDTVAVCIVPGISVSRTLNGQCWLRTMPDLSLFFWTIWHLMVYLFADFEGSPQNLELLRKLEYKLGCPG